MAEKLKVTLVKSPISAIPKHRATVKALGLTKLQKTVELPNNDAVKGMIAQVSHLLFLTEADLYIRVRLKHWQMQPEKLD